MAQQQQPKDRGVDENCKDGSHLFVFTNDKAGMKRTSVDKERTNRIIYEMSKNSLYFKQAELQDQKVDAKVSEMKAKLRLLDSSRKAHLMRQADRIATELEAQRDLDGVCMVVDMDMFYAAVEIRDRPELVDKPVAVGGESMISTTNYHARKWGVRSAMPGFIGRKLCPQLVFIRPDFEKYRRVAEQIRAIFREYDPRMRSYSLDEAYLNVTQEVLKRIDPTIVGDGSARATGQKQSVDSDLGSAASLERSLSLRASSTCTASAVGNQPTRNEGSRDIYREAGLSVETGEGEADEEEGGDTDGVAPLERTPREERRARMFEAAQSLADEIRERIRGETKLTASVGIGPNFMLAKIASDWNKPDGQFCVRGDRAEVLRFLQDLPVRKVGGVGKVMEKCLKEALGVVTCGDLYRERAACMHVMTPNTSRWLIKVSLGIGSSDHDVATEQAEAAGIITRKQISKERTFGELHRPQDLLAKCREICDALATEMESEGLEAKTVGLKIKTTKFQVRTMDSTGNVYIKTAADLYAVASTLLQREIRGVASSSPGGQLRLRLMGVRASTFRGQAVTALLPPGQPTLDGFLAPTPDAMSGGVVEGETGNGPRNGDMETILSGEDHGVDGENASEKQTAPVVGRPGNAAGGTVLHAAVQVTCPVCGEDLGTVSNLALNRHVDACLGVEMPEERGHSRGMMLSTKRTVGGGFGGRRTKRTKAPKFAATGITSIKRFLGPR